jgi:hypothetical protein
MDAVAVAVATSGEEKVTSGKKLYPYPGFAIVTEVTLPLITFAVPVAIVPIPTPIDLGLSNSTVGGEVY